jgi:hypothetical protein
VATLVNLSSYTVEIHRTHLVQKLSLLNTAEIVLYAVSKRSSHSGLVPSGLDRRIDHPLTG